MNLFKDAEHHIKMCKWWLLSMDNFCLDIQVEYYDIYLLYFKATVYITEPLKW